MIEKELWHPVAMSETLGTVPMAVELLERNLVLWRDDGGTVHAWADKCPHRGARLSLGKVCEGRLECPYHGWQFDASGHCVHVPALPEFVPPVSHTTKTYVCLERYGLVWVRMAASHSAVTPALPVFEAEADAQLRKVNCGPYDVATSAPRIVENFLDMAHFAFVHEHWLGSRDTAAIADYQVHSTPTGIRATGCMAIQPKSNLHSVTAAQVEYSYEVTAPFAAVLTKLPEASSVAVTGWRESIGLFICPMGPERSRVWFRLAVADFHSLDQTLRDFQHTIFTQDQPVLESQTPKRLPLDLRAEVHTAADKASSAYRRYLSQQSITFGVIP
ncbi:MAG: aromatic ring-hydroxylating dioxygenase subunit alpha [Rhodoferax sp.]|nr:aromatic ring-hydroxylating dioxygenase subunit alpha [Rhodoferax sp.]